MNTRSAILRSLVESEVGQRWTLADCIAHLLFWLLQCALCCYQTAKACTLCICIIVSKINKYTPSIKKLYDTTLHPRFIFHRPARPFASDLFLSSGSHVIGVRFEVITTPLTHKNRINVDRILDDCRPIHPTPTMTLEQVILDYLLDGNNCR